MVSIRYGALYCLILFVGMTARAEKRNTTKLKEIRSLFYLGGDMGFPSVEADRRTDVSYGRKYTNPLVASVGAGIRLLSFVYIGVRYEYWLATQDYTLSSVNYINELKYMALGPEIGWYSGNPRVFWLLSASGFYPLVMKVTQRGVRTFVKSPSNFTYQVKAMLGVRFDNSLFLHLDGGYRLADFGDLKANGTSFVSGGSSLNFSGIFAGIGLGLSF